MRAFRREPDGTVSARLSREERNVLVTLAIQLTELLDAHGTAASADPALRRLLPDAYRDDSNAAAEFRGSQKTPWRTARRGTPRP